MAKVVFERAARFPGPPFRTSGHAPPASCAAALCDLARPEDELVALALLLSAATGRDAWVDGGRLAVEDRWDDAPSAWPLVERALHARLSIARGALAEAVGAARAGTASAPERLAVEGPRDGGWRSEHRLYAPPGAPGRSGPHRCLRHAGDDASGGARGVAASSYGEFPAADGSRHGLIVFGLSEGYDRDGHAARTLTAAVAGLAHPGRGISPRLAWDSHDFDVAADGPPAGEMARIALSALDAARAAVRGLREGLASLPWGGEPSAFAPEDDDARDLLAAELRAGARVRRAFVGDPLADGARWSFGWREPVAAGAVRLLLGSGAAVHEGDGDGWRRPPVALAGGVAAAADPAAAAGAAVDAFLARSPGLDASRAHRDGAVEAARRMASGGRLEHADDDLHGYLDDDGLPLAGHVVDRLRKADLLAREGDRWTGPWCPATLAGTPELAAAPARTLAPRAEAVGFAAFRAYCGYRCHGEGKECRKAGNDGWDSRCDVTACPITERAYAGDRHGVGRWLTGGGDDPAWDREVEEDCERDLPVVALHPNTARSPAFRAAGRRRVEALVEVVAGAMMRYGAGYLVERCHDGALDEAAAAGHLVVTGDLGPGFGRTAVPGPALMARIAEARAVAAAAGGTSAT